MTKSTTEKKFQTGGYIPASQILWLTSKQASARMHALTHKEKMKPRGAKPDQRVAYETLSPVYFKAGEVIQIDGDLDRRMEVLFGDNLPKTDGDGAGQDRKPTDDQLAAANKAVVEMEKSVEALRVKLTQLADDLFVADADLKAAEEARAALGDDADDAAKAAADAAVMTADNMIAGVEQDIAAFLSNFRSPAEGEPSE